jgi:hypothetical protein
MLIYENNFDVDQPHSDLLKVTTDIPTLTTLAKNTMSAPLILTNHLLTNTTNLFIIFYRIKD